MDVTSKESSPVNVPHVLRMHKQTLDEHALTIHELKLAVWRLQVRLGQLEQSDPADVQEVSG